MKRQALRLMVAGALMVVVAVLFAGTASSAVPTGSATNQPGNWETHLLVDRGVNAECFKHEANNAGFSVSSHGTSLGNSVKLFTFNQSWFGDHWALLIIKAGQTNRVIYGPTANVWHQSTSGQTVSHWIVCKGETPPPPTTTLPEEPPTTTVPEEPPTTTVPPEEPPTTTVPEPPTTTVPEVPTTTVPELPTTTIVTPPSTTVVPTPPAVVVESSQALAPQPEVLAYTGSGLLVFLASTGVILILMGITVDRSWRRFR